MRPKNEPPENFTEKLVKSQRIYQGKVISLDYDLVTLPNGKEAFREVVRHPGAVAVVPIAADGKVILVRQYRHAVGKVLLEIPAGKLAAGEDIEECARRELTEETGFTAKRLRKLTSIYTAPGFADEVIHIYAAEELTGGTPCPDEDEFLKAEAYTKEEIRELIQKEFICDAKSLVGLALAGIFFD